jgi:CRP/FNR family transcriptional regulator
MSGLVATVGSSARNLPGGAIVAKSKVAQDSDHAFSMLDRFGQDVSISAGRSVFGEGDPAEHCYRVEEGVMRLCRFLSDGRRQIIAFIGEGQYFGLSGTRTQTLTAEAVTDVKLTRYARKCVDDLVATRPAFARAFFAFAGDELREAQKRLVVLGRNTAIEKLASFLVEIANLDGSPTIKPREVRLPMCRRDIADYLGLTLETVSRLFGQLKQAGLVKLLAADLVVILKRDALEDMVEGAIS